jgi:hypothetical protein
MHARSVKDVIWFNIVVEVRVWEPQGTAPAKLNLPLRVNHEAMLLCRVVFVGVKVLLSDGSIG